jgi:hypothetical protein
VVCSQWLRVMLFGVSVLPVLASAAVRGDEAMYVGGTIAAVQPKTEGKLDLSNDAFAVFTAKGGKFSISYKGITSIEYGQKAGRRVGAALAVSPVLLFSKKRKHFLSVGYQDEQGNKQGAVFELSKGTVHSIATTFQTRSGKQIEFESSEAKEHFEKEMK